MTLTRTEWLRAARSHATRARDIKRPWALLEILIELAESMSDHLWTHVRDDFDPDHWEAFVTACERERPNMHRHRAQALALHAAHCADCLTERERWRADVEKERHP